MLNVMVDQFQVQLGSVKASKKLKLYTTAKPQKHNYCTPQGKEESKALQSSCQTIYFGALLSLFHRCYFFKHVDDTHIIVQ